MEEIYINVGMRQKQLKINADDQAKIIDKITHQ